jgi:hypothetical protein
MSWKQNVSTAVTFDVNGKKKMVPRTPLKEVSPVTHISAYSIITSLL